MEVLFFSRDNLFSKSGFPIKNVLKNVIAITTNVMSLGFYLHKFGALVINSLPCNRSWYCYYIYKSCDS